MHTAEQQPTLRKVHLLGRRMIPTESSFCSCAVALGFALLLTGCGQSTDQKTPPPPPVSVTLDNTSLTLQTAATHQFKATVQGSTNTTVTWTVDSKDGGNSAVGTIDASGLYTAPADAGTHTVTATSKADSTKSASAKVTVQVPPPPPSVSISPGTSTLGVSATQQFAATVQNVTNPSLAWSVDGVGGGNSTVGTITDQGLYTAPSQFGNHTVAVNVGSTTASASSSVTVFSLSVTPGTSTLGFGATQQFTAIVQNLTNPSLAWSVDGVGGGNSSVGTISDQGLYTAPSQVGNHTVGVNVSSTSATASSSLTVFSLSVTPAGVVLVPGATQQYTASAQGLSNPSFTWFVDGTTGGSSSIGTISSSGLYTAPSGTGPHTISVSATADTAVTAQTGLTVINSSQGSVLTYHNDSARSGAFTQETSLMPSVVNSSQFGKLRSYSVDGQIYAQPLFVPQLEVNGATHNVVFVATENDTVYAFDADGTQTSPLWQVSLGVPSPRNDSEGISPVLGITSTPVIDITTNTMYVVATTTSGPFYLHALDITTGSEKFGGPVSVSGSVAGTGWDSNNGTIDLENGCYQRTGLALNPVTNEIYIGFGHCNHGWLFAYDKTSLQQKAIFNDTPDGAGGGLWNGGGAPSVDEATGKVYITTGVDANDPPSGFNDSFLRLSGDSLSEEDFFQPDNESYLDLNDADLASGSPVLMPDNPSSTPHEVISGGKDGNIFVVNRDDMGSFSASSNNVIQTVHTGVKEFNNIFSTPAYWNGNLYMHCSGDVLHTFTWSSGLMSTQPTTSGSFVLTTHGATVSISSNGSNNGIAWEIDNSNFSSSGPAVLRAYDATNVANELYDSTQAGSRDTAGTALKFTVPTIASGKVFVGTQNELDIYGLLGP